MKEQIDQALSLNRHAYHVDASFLRALFAVKQKKGHGSIRPRDGQLRLCDSKEVRFELQKRSERTTPSVTGPAYGFCKRGSAECP